MPFEMNPRLRPASPGPVLPAELENGPDLSIVVPVYRSTDSLPRLVERIQSAIEPTGRTWEAIFVDDSGPDDRPWRVLEGLVRRDLDRLRALRLMRNFGQHNALMCGFHAARGAFVVTLDDDLQNPPEEIPRLLAAIEERGDDLVYGTITEEKQHGLFRNFGSWLVMKFGQTIFRSTVKGSSYRIMRRELVRSILTYDLNFTFVDGLLAWNTQRISAIPVRHDARPQGRSGYSFFRLLALAINMFTNFSLLPLQFVSLLGLLAATGGLLLGAYYLVAHFAGWIAVSGYASLIVTTLVLGGMQLLSLGVMGEYLGRVHLNINRKPQFVVRTALGFEGDASPGETRNAGDFGHPADQRGFAAQSSVTSAAPSAPESAGSCV